MNESTQVNNKGTFTPQMQLTKMGCQDLKLLITAALGWGQPRIAVSSEGPAADQLTKPLLSNTSLCTPGKTLPTW